MTKLPLYLLLFFIPAIYGGYSILKAVRQVRTPRKYNGARFDWTEQPGATFTYDRPGWSALTIHRLGVIAIGVVVLLTLLLQPLPRIALPGMSESTILAVEPLLYVAVTLIGFLWGLSFFGPLAERIGGKHHYAVADEGLIGATQFMPWSAFRDFRVSEDGRAILVSSASMPGTYGYVLAPPNSSDVLRLTGILGQHLPAAQPPADDMLQRYVFPGLMALLCVVFVGASILLFFTVPAGTAILADTFLIWILLWLGGVLIMHLIYGGKARRAELEEG